MLALRPVARRARAAHRRRFGRHCGLLVVAVRAVVVVVPIRGRAVTPVTLSAVAVMISPLILMLVHPAAIPATVIAVSHVVRTARKRQQHSDKKVRRHAMEEFHGLSPKNFQRDRTLPATAAAPLHFNRAVT
jgi:hypothetical protein